MKLACGRKIILQGEVSEERHLRRNFIGSNGDNATTTERDERESDGVVTRENQEIAVDGVENSSHLSDVSRGFLDSDNVLDAGQALHSGRLDVHAGASLNAIENDGERNGGGQGFVMLVQAFLSGLAVIGGDGKNAVDTHGSKFLREGNYFGGVVSTCAGEHRYTTFGQIQGQLHDTEMLFMRESGALAGGAAGNQEIDSRVELALHQQAQRRFIQGTVGTKRSNHRRTASNKHKISL